MKVGNNITTSFTFDKVLQIRSTTKREKQIINSSILEYNIDAEGSKITNFTVNITPSSTSSKIFLMINLFVAGSNDSYIQGLVKKTINGTTTTLIANTGVGSASNLTFGVNNTNASNIDDNLLYPIGFRYLDTPNTTDEISYFVHLRNRYTGNVTNSLIYINSPELEAWSQPSSISTITAFEIGS